MTHQSASQAVQAWIGIDVSKATLDAYLLAASGGGHIGQFTNDPSGFSKLLKWAKRHSADACGHFCLEATGAYSQEIALFLAERNEHVSVVNPYRVHHAGISQGKINRTDRASAKLLAEYCQKEQPPFWKAPAPHIRTLLALVRHLDTLGQERARNSNRLQEPGRLKTVQKSLEKIDELLGSQIEEIEQEIAKHIDNHPDLKNDQKLLLTIPGIGRTTANRILAELPDVSLFSSAKEVAAFVGLQPRLCQSGTSVHKRPRMSKRGNPHLRKALFLPAMTAIRFNPSIQALSQRLAERQKSKMAIVGAAMRKLLMIAFGVLRSQKAFYYPKPATAP